MTREELYRKGEEMRRQLGLAPRPTPSPMASVPGMQRFTTEAVFGGIWGRPGLDLRYRVLTTLSVLTVLQRLPQLRTYINSALTIGMSPRELQEVFIQGGLYAGFPTAVNSLGVAQEIFQERGISVPPAEVPEVSLEELERRGRARRQELMGGGGQEGYTAAAAELAPDLSRFVYQYGYGEVWYRPGLDPKSRVVVTIAAFTALGREPQLKNFLMAARNVGFSQGEVMEILMHTAPYAGIPAALNAVALAQPLFAHAT
ncbi:MAG: carboxymuconolactone decarboxylase family protein [Nitrospinae bacterium]|nr:carboxymuconolactone decarboxylase family protein [Nitrospinota bacterium]